ncbi:winged helix-turn-helix transcriptional regulator [Fusibacter ferrireducens]|uniref:Helix-turn-helix transcriptional regulator n=1 Tax=Fusibacter ferrireducens TaxID=2785058 RepID=A0ABR9ZSA2_9FIRM|nr:helix-turn-helix domain-containing protein [Fusibacter ferrireducens]MBF4692509.1 helix-turn-helix transcriptional regulator [Fusibacter ferrireducens]
MLTQEELFGKCPYATSQKILSGKWALIILFHLRDHKYRFNELQKALPDITQTTLTKQLRTLEAYGMITRTVYPQIPPKVEYELSALGNDFSAVLDSLEAWGNKYIEHQQHLSHLPMPQNDFR